MKKLLSVAQRNKTEVKKCVAAVEQRNQKRKRSRFARLFGATGAATGGAGALGAFGVCHSICQAAIAALAVFGVSIGFMPLAKPMAFLEKYNAIFISLGILSILLSIYLFYRQRKVCKHERKH